MTRSPHLYRLLRICAALAALTAGALAGAPPPPAAAQAESPPQTLLDGRVVNDWAVAGPRLLWLSYPDCSLPEGRADAVRLLRLATTGGASRVLFFRNEPRPITICNPYRLNSNLVADANFVYWVDGGALVRLPVTANPGDPPQPWGPTFGGERVELALAGDRIVAMQAQTCAICIVGTRFELVSTADGSSVSTMLRDEFGGSPGYDGKYLYFKNADSALRRLVPGSSPQPLTIAANVVDYVAEGATRLCGVDPPICDSSNNVYYIERLGRDSIVRYNNILGGYRTLYTTTQPLSERADLAGLTLALRGAAGSAPSLFFFEKRAQTCPPQVVCVMPATDLLRTVPSGGGPLTDLYLRETDTAHVAQGLTSDGCSVYWREQAVTGPALPSTIKRMPADAAALPRVNLTVTGLEITQGIQRADNSVPLVQLRPTFVRVFARAAGQSVPGVTAQLQASAEGLGTVTLSPVNPGLGTRIRVLTSPSRGVTNDSFLFELPWAFTQVPDLRLRATVNPFGAPLEPTLADNTLQAGPFVFRPTGRLSVTFVEFSYRLNNTDYQPQGTYQNVSWIRRVYPLGASIGAGGWNDGLSYNVWQVSDAGLAARVNRQSPECDGYAITRKPDGSVQDDREFCASEYVNALLRDLRSRRSVPAGTFLYGEIPDPGNKDQFPRGQEGGSSVSSGPDGPAYNGFYAGHEIGHSLGLGHPETANGSCDLVGSDPTPPHYNGWIGTADSTIVGFDSADGSLRGARAVLGGASYFDMMAYCQPQWISDRNYERIIARLAARPAALAAETAEAGDWLSVYGSLDAAGDRAAVALIRRLADTVVVPDRAPGGYTLRLLDGQGAQLADYPFTPEPSDDGAGRAGFGLVVPFVVGARQVQIVRLSSGAPVYSQAISAAAPSVSAVALQGASAPASGIATLAWSAADADGDGLRSEVLFSRDGGASFTPLLGGLSGGGAPVNMALVGGGSVIFRVIVSDGVQSAAADSAPVTVAPQPPLPQILTPADGARLEWGQLVNLRGEARDAQDGSVASAGLAWSSQRGALGGGPQISLAELPVGTSVITLTATNSAGLSASTSVTVVVSDDLSEPGPMLAASPDALSWNAEPGASTPLTATLTLRNSGGGALTWAAASDVPWLRLSAATGDEGALVTVSADPSGLATNSAATGQISFQARDAAGQPLQGLVVPVTIFVGNPGFGPPADTGGRIRLYFPVIRR